MEKHEILSCIGFQWDDGNAEKNWISHQVAKSECEQIFFNQPLELLAKRHKASEFLA